MPPETLRPVLRRDRDKGSHGSRAPCKAQAHYTYDSYIDVVRLCLHVNGLGHGEFVRLVEDGLLASARCVQDAADQAVHSRPEQQVVSHIQEGGEGQRQQLVPHLKYHKLGGSGIASGLACASLTIAPSAQAPNRR